MLAKGQRGQKGDNSFPSGLLELSEAAEAIRPPVSDCSLNTRLFSCKASAGRFDPSGKQDQFWGALPGHFEPRKDQRSAGDGQRLGCHRQRPFVRAQHELPRLYDHTGVSTRRAAPARPARRETHRGSAGERQRAGPPLRERPTGERYANERCSLAAGRTTRRGEALAMRRWARSGGASRSAAMKYKVSAGRGGGARLVREGALLSAVLAGIGLCVRWPGQVVLLPFLWAGYPLLSGWSVDENDTTRYLKRIGRTDSFSIFPPLNKSRDLDIFLDFSSEDAEVESFTLKLREAVWARFCIRSH